jgi:hypothetical protein
MKRYEFDAYIIIKVHAHSVLLWNHGKLLHMEVF